MRTHARQDAGRVQEQFWERGGLGSYGRAEKGSDDAKGNGFLGQRHYWGEHLGRLKNGQGKRQQQQVHTEVKRMERKAFMAVVIVFVFVRDDKVQPQKLFDGNRIPGQFSFFYMVLVVLVQIGQLLQLAIFRPGQEAAQKNVKRQYFSCNLHSME